MSKYDRRTSEWCRNQGLFPWKVEVFNGFSGFKTDLYYIIDYLAIDENRTVGIQSCGADFAAHIVKFLIDERENTKLWLSSPNRELILIGWRKLKVKRGGKAFRYHARIAYIKFDTYLNKLSYEEVE